MSGIVVEQLRAGYGRVEVLHGVDMTLPAGEIVALVGHNGAGKSTLLRAIAGTVRPRRGRVGWDGTDITRWSPHRRATAGLTYVPDERNVFATLTVEENLGLFGRPAPLDTIVDRALDVFPELGAHLAQRAGTLSGGERQMLALTRALVRPSRVLLLDEVSRGLASGVTARFYDELSARLVPDQVVVVCEQFLDTALGHAGLVYALRRGQVAFAGSPGDFAARTDTATAHGR